MSNLIRTTSEDKDFQYLVALLDQDLRIRDGDEHSFYAQFNKIDTIRHVIVYYADDNMPVGCGAFKQYDSATVEIKRMFVEPASRGKGVASTLLTALEQWAAELHFTSCILETGKKQPEAIGLYLKSGYTVTPNFGQYEHVENSVCMQKVISNFSK